MKRTILSLVCLLVAPLAFAQTGSTNKRQTTAAVEQPITVTGAFIITSEEDAAANTIDDAHGQHGRADHHLYLAGIDQHPALRHGRSDPQQRTLCGGGGEVCAAGRHVVGIVGNVSPQSFLGRLVQLASKLGY